MNGILMTLGNELMTGRIEWPVDGVVLALSLFAALVLLIAGLVHEAEPTRAVGARVKDLRPRLPRPLRHLPAA